MAAKLAFALLFAQYSLVLSFVVTSYYEEVSTTLNEVLGSIPATATWNVFPTGPVTGTATSTSIWTYLNGLQHISIPITYEFILLPTNAAAATIVDTYNLTTIGVPQSSTSSVNIFTSYYAPAIVTPPTSCTITKFSYTTAVSIDLPTDILSLITPLSITTYIFTESTDLGNQVTTTYQCDIYLSVGLIPSLSPPDYDYNLLTECVDPRRWDCYQTSLANTGGCPTNSPPYPTGSAGPVTTSQPSGATAATTGTSSKATTTAKTGGADSLSLRMMREHLIFAFIVVPVLVFHVLM